MSSTNGRNASPRRSWSLAARLTTWYAASAFLLVAGATGFLYWTLTAHMDQEDDQRLADKVHVLRTVLRGGATMIETLRPEVEPRSGAGPYARFLIRIAEPGGRILLETPGMTGELPRQTFPPPASSQSEPGGGVEVNSAAGRCYRVVAATADTQQSASLLLHVALDCTEEEKLMAGYRRNLALVLVAAVAICALLGYYVASRGLRPLAAISATARQVGSATLDERISVGGLPAELQELATAFNEMLNRLEDSFERLSQFSSDIAHELRTPVNNLRGEAEVALQRSRSPEEYRESLSSCLEECGRLTSLIDSLLFLARAEHPETTIQRSRVDIGRELTVIRDFYQAAATEAGILMRVPAAESLHVPIDRTLFQRAIGNLVANALAHTPRGGTVTLSANTKDDLLLVTVTDTGAGISPDHLPHIFDRFYRADPARTSRSGRVGLGLAIVKSIMILHHGSIQVESTPGKGTAVALMFPVATKVSDPACKSPSERR